ncbi:TonB-dependent receptor [Abyssalbus ytuae]|uniref:TonB-dependent receptor n=1 Tax=Abyssalbus ytuae TaxID=2926907 RepID=A0A9E6ZM75_9FLAO|nr:TonB-dependent receptor [Abyssalbus ytuae]UOB17239.1 TonB-dependent receptor [Abyssalbus ytuae]
MKRILFLTVFLASLCLNAQTLTQTVKGKILDITTGAPLMGATVTLLNASPAQGTATDENGIFKLENVPIGRQSFLVNYLGYKERIISEILVGSAKEVNLTIQLEESLQQLNEVIVTAPTDNTRPLNKLATVSARSFSVEETKRFPVSVSDPGRMALSFPGVTNSDDGTNEIIIRGNSANQLLWKIEGIEVPEPNHFSDDGLYPGAVSLISTNMLAKSDFFTGAFPAEYGNATSGVFDIRLRNGNNEKKEFAFQFGVLGTDLAIEGPFSKNYNGSFLVNYRYSTLALLDKIIDISDGDGVPVFQDLSLKLHFPLSSKTSLSYWGIGGINESNDYDAEVEEENIIVDDEFSSKTYMTGLNFKHFFNSNNILDAVISYSGNDGEYYYEERSQSSNLIQETDNIESENTAFRFNVNYTNKLNARSTLKTGAVVSILNYDVYNDKTINDNQTVQANENGSGNMYQFYSQFQYKLNEKLSATFGFHTTHFSVNDDFVIEPRVGAEYKINNKHTLSAGFGMHSRRMPLIQYFVTIENDQGNIITPNKDLKLMRSAHYVLGYDWRIIKNGHIKLEAYYQHLKNVAVDANPSYTGSFVNGLFIDRELTDTSTGKNYGIELTFEKFFSRQYYYLITTSLFDAKYKAVNGKWYDSRYNFNYTINAVGGKEFSIGKTNNNLLGVNAKILLNGGKRTTPFDIEQTNLTGEDMYIEDQRNKLELDEYYRVDTSIYYRINRPKVSHIISLDIQNVLNRENEYELYYNRDTQTVGKYHQLGMLPLLNYRIEF